MIVDPLPRFTVKKSFILYVSNHVFDLGHLYSSNCGLNALHKIISLLKGKKIFHMIIQFWDICEKNMENEQWQINRKKDNCKHIYIYIYIILILKFQQKKKKRNCLDLWGQIHGNATIQTLHDVL